MNLEELKNINVELPSTINATTANPAAFNPAAGVSSNIDYEKQADDLWKTINSTKDLSNATVTTVDYDKYKDYDVALTADTAAMNKQRAENQSNWEKLGNALSQTLVSEIGLGIATSFSDMFDLIGSKIFNIQNDDYNSELTKFIEGLQEKFNNDVAPIYRDENLDISNGGLTDFGWWANNIPTIAGSLTLLLPSKFFTFALGKVAKGIKLASKASKLTESVSKLNRGLGALRKENKASRTLSHVLENANKRRVLIELTPTQKAKAAYWAETISDAAFSRTMENYQEARQTHQETHDNVFSYLSEMTPEEREAFIAERPQYKDMDDEAIAQAVASEAADKTFLYNYINTGFDILEFHGANKAFKKLLKRPHSIDVDIANERIIRNFGRDAADIARELESKTLWRKSGEQIGLFARKALGFTKEGLLTQWNEGLEEAVNYVAGEEGKHYGKYLVGLDDDSSFKDRLVDYLKNPQLYESAFWGYFGGIAFGAGYKGFNKLSNYITKQSYDMEKSMKYEIESRNDKWESYLGKLNMIDSDVNPFLRDDNGLPMQISNEGERRAARIQAEEEFKYSLAKSVAQAGTADLYEAWLSDKKIQEAFINSGLASKEDIGLVVQDMLDKVREVNDMYESAVTALDKLGINPNIAQIIADEDVTNRLGIKRLDNSKSALDKVIDKARNKMSSAEQYDFNKYRNITEYLAWLDQIRSLQHRIASKKDTGTYTSKMELEYLNKMLDTAKRKFDALNTVLDLDYMAIQADRIVTGVDEEGEHYVFDDAEYEKKRDAIIEERAKLLSTYDTNRTAAISAASAQLEAEEERFESDYETLRNQFKAYEDDIANSIINDIQRADYEGKLLNKADDITKRARYLDLQMRSAVDNTIKEANKTLGDIYDKYDTDQVYDYIDASLQGKENTATIDGITNDDKKKLDEAIELISTVDPEFTAQNIVNTNNSAYIDAKKNKAQKAQVTANGKPVNPDTVEEEKEVQDDEAGNQNDTVPPTGGTPSTPSTPAASPAPTPTPVTPSSAVPTVPQPTTGSRTQALGEGYDPGEPEPSDGTVASNIDNEELIHNVSKSVIDKFISLGKAFATTDEDFENIKKEVLKDPSFATSDRSVVEEAINNQIQVYRNLIAKKQAAANARNTIASTIASFTLASIPYNYSAKTANDVATQFNKALEEFLNVYVENNKDNVQYSKGKYYIDLEDVLRFYNNSGTGMDTLIKIMYDSVSDMLLNTNELEETNPIRQKYVVLNEEQVGSEKLLENVFKTEEQLVQERLGRLSSMEVDITNIDKDNDDWKKTLDSLNPGDVLRGAIRRTRTGTPYISLSKNNVEVGAVWIANRDKDGKFTKENQGFVYKVWEEDGEIKSNMTDFLSKVFKGKEAWAKNLRELVVEYNHSKDVTPDERKAIGEKIKKLCEEHASDLLGTYATAQNLSRHLGALYDYVYANANIQSNVRTQTASIKEWINKLYTSYTNVYAMASGNYNIVVDRVNDGELLRAKYREVGDKKVYDLALPKGTDEKPGGIAKISEASIGVPVYGGTRQHIFTGETNPKTIGRNFGNKYVAVKNKNGAVFYYNMFSRPLSSEEFGEADVTYEEGGNKISLVDEFVTSIYDKIIERYDSKEDSYDNLVEYLNSLFGTSSNQAALFEGATIKTDANSVSIIANDAKITIFKSSRISGGKGGIQITKNGTREAFKIASSDETKKLEARVRLHDELKEMIKQGASFGSYQALVNLNNGPSGNKLGIFSKTKEGKFRVKVGKFDRTYDSYSSFLLENDLCLVTARQENGSNFGRVSEGQLSNDTLHIRLEERTSPPVGETSQSKTSTETTEEPSTNPLKDKIQGVIATESRQTTGIAVYNEIFDEIEKNKDNNKERNNKSRTPLKPEYRGKIIYAESGTGKTTIADNVDVIDGDIILGNILGVPPHLTGDAFLMIGTERQNQAIEELKKRMLELKAQGKTVVTPNKNAIELADVVIYKPNVEATTRNTNAVDRGNVIASSKYHQRQLDFIEKSDLSGKEVRKLDDDQFLGDIILTNPSFNKQVEDVRQTDSIDTPVTRFLKEFGISVEEFSEAGYSIDYLEKVIRFSSKEDLTDATGEMIAFMMQYNPDVKSIIAQLAIEKGYDRDKVYAKNKKGEEIVNDSFYKSLDKREYYKVIGKSISQELKRQYDYAKSNGKFDLSTESDNTLLSKIKSIIKAFIDKILNNEALLRDLDIYSKRVAINVLQNNPSFIKKSLLKPGDERSGFTTQVDLAKALDEHPYEADIIRKITSIKNISLAGSAAMSAQITIYRPAENPLHDLDFATDGNMTREQLEEELNKKFEHLVHVRQIKNDSYVTETYLTFNRPFKILEPNEGEVVYSVVDTETNEIIATFTGSNLTILKDGVKGKFLDFFTQKTKKYKAVPFEHNGHTIYIDDYRAAMTAKLEYGRLKDIWDYNRFVKLNKQQDKDYKDLLKRLDNLGLSHGNIIFDTNLDAYAEYDPKTDSIKIGNSFFDFFDESSKEYNPIDGIRVLVHENLHRLIYKNDKRDSIKKNMESIFKEFENLSDDEISESIKKTDIYKRLSADPSVNKDELVKKLTEYIKEFKFVNNKNYNTEEQRYEEFLVESITRADFADFLNQVQAKNASTSEESIFTKILNLLKDIFGFNVNKGSLMERNVNEILRILKDIDTNSTETEISNIDTSSSTSTSSSETTEDLNRDVSEKDLDDALDESLIGDTSIYDSDNDYGDGMFASIASVNSFINIPSLMGRVNQEFKSDVRSEINEGRLSTICR